MTNREHSTSNLKQTEQSQWRDLPVYIQLALLLAILRVLLSTPEVFAQTPGVARIQTCLYPQQFTLATSPGGRSYIQFDTQETWWKKAELTVNTNGTAVITYGIGGSAEPASTITFFAETAKLIPASQNNQPIQDIEISTTPNSTLMVTLSQRPGVSECKDVGINPDPTVTQTLTPTPSATFTAIPTAGATETPTMTATIIPTAVTPEYTATATTTPTGTVIVEVTPTATSTPTATIDHQGSAKRLYLPIVQR